MRQIALSMTVIVLSITVGMSLLALLIGRITPTPMLTATLREVVRLGSRYSPQLTSILLIDLNRHLRVRLPIPIDGVIDRAYIQENGQELLIQTASPENKMYTYNIITDTLRELNTTYTDPDTDEMFQAQNIFSWLDNGDVWIYDQEYLALYRLDFVSNTLQRVVRLLDADDDPYFGNMSPSVAPSGAQAVIFDQTTMYLFNADGSNLRSYPNPIEDGRYIYGYWSEDERFFYVSESLTTPLATVAFRTLDLNTGEIVESTQGLEGRSFFIPCGTENEWLSYVNTDYEAQILNVQTGETRNLSLLPELAGRQMASGLWMPNCEWLFVSTQPIVGITAFSYQAMFIVSRDGQTIYPLGDAVSIVSQFSANHFLLAEGRGAEDMIYDIHFDGTVHKTPVSTIRLREFVLSGSWVTPLYGDPYRLARYESQSSHVAVMNLRTGAIEIYFAPNEVLGSFPVQWLWN